MVSALQAPAAKSFTEGQLDEVNALIVDLNAALQAHEKLIAPISDTLVTADEDPAPVEGIAGKPVPSLPDSAIGKRLAHVQQSLRHTIGRVTDMTGRLRV